MEEHCSSLQGFSHFVQHLLCSLVQDTRLALQVAESGCLCFTCGMDIAESWQKKLVCKQTRQIVVFPNPVSVTEEIYVKNNENLG